MMNIAVRPICSDDVPSVLSIQLQNPAAAQWQAADYLALVGAFTGVALVAVAGAGPKLPLGFVVFRQAADEAELLNLAVDRAYQRQGIAHALLSDGIRHLIQAGVRHLFLEVRASNQPALALYRSFGFERYGVRKQYYQNPEEDAEVWRFDIKRA